MLIFFIVDLCPDGFEYFANRCYKLEMTPKSISSAKCENGGSLKLQIDDIDAFYIRKHGNCNNLSYFCRN